MTAGGEPSSGRFERLILRAYPAAFRKRYGCDFLRFLARQRAEARFRSRPLGPVRYWMEVGWDALRSGLRAHIEERKQNRGWTMGVGFEARTAVRTLARSRGFVATVALTLGLGIGAATAIYSIADWVVLRPVPGVVGHERIVTVRFQHQDAVQSGRAGGWFLVSNPDLVDLREGARAFSALGGELRADAHVVLPGADAPRRMPLDLVTREYFDALGVRADMGRLPQPRPGEDTRLVLVSDRLWRTTLGADPAVAGRTLTIDGQPFTISGVAPPDFHGPAPAERTTDLWAPADAHAVIIPNYPDDALSRRDVNLYFTVFGRLRDGVTVEAARAELAGAREAILDGRGAESSLYRFVPVVDPGVGVSPWVRERAETTLSILLAAVVLLLLLGCANAGNLLLTRAVGRGHEYSMRRALGAGRGHIAGRLLAEGVVLGVLGGAVGLGFARALLALYGGERLAGWLPALGTVPLDVRAFAFAAGAALVTGVLFSVVPALTTARASDTQLRAGVRVAYGGTGALRRTLVAVQVALSLAIVVGAGLLVDTVRSLGRVELGFRPEGVLEATLDPATQGYDDAERQVFWRTLVERTRSLPQVRAAGLAYAPLHGRIGSDTGVSPEGAPAEEEAIDTHLNAVSEGFLAATGIELLAGRDFLAEEVLADPPRDVVIVSESLARALFDTPPKWALGARVTLAWRNDWRLFEVVGVIADVRSSGVKDEYGKLLLEPIGQAWVPTWLTLYMKGEPAAASLLDPLRSVVRDLDPSLPLYDVQTLSERVAGSFAEERLLARLTTLFGAMALALAGLGLYGTIAFAVTARTRELGIRIALGARPDSLRAVMVRHAFGLVALGLGPGLLLALAVSRVMRSRLFGVAPFDPAVYAVATATLLAVAAVASWIPARRATKVDPVRALAEG